jgi:hypothetical protein
MLTYTQIWNALDRLAASVGLSASGFDGEKRRHFPF